MLARLAARLLLAPLGFVCGALAACGVLLLMAADDVASALQMPGDVMLMGYDVSVSLVTIVLLFAPLIGAPAIAAVLIAEMFSIRSWPYHAIAGAAAAALPWSLLPASFDGQIFAAPQILAAGFVGGLVHWLVAGRSAGLAPPAGR